MTGKLCEEYGEYLCSYCSYRQPLGHCQYYHESYTLKDSKVRCMTENKRYSFNWERGHPQFWDNYCDLADCYLTCEDVVKLLNELNDEVKSQSLVIKEYQNRNEALFEEIARQKFTKRMMRDNIKDYEKSIKNLRKSYEKFDEMRLRRIRFLEKRLRKNGLSIYVNDAGDV